MADEAPNHFSSPLLSNWQSAVARIASRASQSVGAGMNQATHALLSMPRVDFNNPMIQAAAKAALAHVQAGLNPATATSAAPAPAALQGVDKCAHAALQVALDRLAGNATAAIQDAAVLQQFGGCDPAWADCITEFVAHYAFTKHADTPYRKWRGLSDFVMDDLPDTCTIGIIGDWGTSDHRAQQLLLNLAQHNVDLLLHLGDIYYSCSTMEATAFYENVVRAFAGKPLPRILTLCGNHDMYSGGAPYYALLDRLHQPASYFCLRNAHWQFLAMDTGYNDFDPLQVQAGTTWVQDDEMEWHIDKLRSAAGRRSVLLSHHQPFSINSALAGKWAVNDRLLSPFVPWLNDIALWFWGHEHNQSLYEPFRGVQRGRCIGASAIPTQKDETIYDISPAFKNPDGSLNQPVPQLIQSIDTRLRIDPDLALYHLGFAIMKLNGPTCTCDYIEYNSTHNTPRTVWSESL